MRGSRFYKGRQKNQKTGLKRGLKRTKGRIGDETMSTSIKLFKIIPMPRLSVGGIMVYWYMGKSDGPFRINRTEIRNFKAFDLKKVWQMFKQKQIKLTEPFLKELKYFLKQK